MFGPNPDVAAGRREVDGVADEIAEDVRDLLAVRKKRRYVVRDVHGQLELLLGQQRLIEPRYLINDFREREGRGSQGELVRRAARVREDLAYLVEQLPTAGDDPADALELALVHLAQHPVAKDLGVGDHRGERRAEI